MLCFKTRNQIIDERIAFYNKKYKMKEPQKLSWKPTWERWIEIGRVLRAIQRLEKLKNKTTNGNLE